MTVSEQPFNEPDSPIKLVTYSQQLVPNLFRQLETSTDHKHTYRQFLFSTLLGMKLAIYSKSFGASIYLENIELDAEELNINTVSGVTSSGDLIFSYTLTTGSDFCKKLWGGGERLGGGAHAFC